MERTKHNNHKALGRCLIERENMWQLTHCTVFLLVVHSAITATMDLVSVARSGEVGTCLARGERDAAIQDIRASVVNRMLYPYCGFGLWYRVAHLNMSNSSQQCPSAWREYNSSGVRGCRRPESSSGSCHATFYRTSRQYSRVCGRVIGYQIGSPDAFASRAVGQTIDSYYVYGVSVTHGEPRNHIWTLAVGLTEGRYPSQQYNCPCSKPGDPNNISPPSFVGNNYYCESGNPADTVIFSNLYSTDPLWDGHQCEGQCCSDGKSPPWFSVDLPNPTIDNIEVRICMGQRSSHDDATIQLLELYVQYD